MDFKIHFHRYNRTSCQSRLSAAWFTRAETLQVALNNAQLFLNGMRQAGCDEDLIVASIDTVGLRGEECVDGLTIWETEAERQARSAG